MNALYEFGAYRLDRAKRLLTCRNEAIPLAPKSFDLLLLFLDSGGRALEKGELMNAIWPDTAVEESNLTFQISTLRKVLVEETNCIETIPKHGYRFAIPVTGLPGDSLPAGLPAGVPLQRSAKYWYAALFTLVAGGLACSVYFLRPVTSEAEFTAMPLTTYPGHQRNPSLSPDGSQVAFSWNGPGEDNYDIYVKLVGPGEPIRLTSDRASDEIPAWSPDGQHIAFLRFYQTSNAGLFVIPALGGGGERKLADVALASESGAGSSDVSWTPDGKWLTVCGRLAEDPLPGIWLISLQGARPIRVTTFHGSEADLGPSFSPDGRSMAYIHRLGTSNRDVYVIPLSNGYSPSGPPVRLTFRNRLFFSAVWTFDANELILSSAAHFGNSRLERIRRDDSPSNQRSEPRLLPLGGEAMAFALTTSLSRNGKFVYSRYFINSHIWRLPLPPTAAREPARLISSTLIEGNPDYSPDGQKIAFSSTRSGFQEIWVANADGSRPVRLTSVGGRSTSNPRWSRDGRSILFDSGRDGSADLYLIEPGNGAMRRLTDDPANETHSSWSLDGLWIYFTSDKTGRNEVWKMPSTGGAATQITKDGGLSPRQSLDGKWIYYSKGIGSTGTLWKTTAAGGDESKIADGVSYSQNFVVSEGGIYFLALEDAPKKTSIAYFNFESQTVKPVAKLNRQPWHGMAISPDQRSLLFTVVEHAGSNLMLVDHFR